jgi:hypothetical protein
MDSIAFTMTDYVNAIDYGKVVGPASTINACFGGSLLLELVPER